jgi:hypothetical protein
VLGVEKCSVVDMSSPLHLEWPFERQPTDVDAAR